MKISVKGKVVTADALLTQRELANYIVGERQAHYCLTAKGNQPNLHDDISFYFHDRKEPDFIDKPSCDYGRVETRKIWTTTELNDYVKFPYVGQTFVIERHCTDKKNGQSSSEVSYGITSQKPEQADAEHVLYTRRGHWSIESCHYIIDWNYDEDRSRIRSGYGPENVTRLRRFAISVIKSKGVRRVAQKMRELTRNVRLVFDYLRMSKNSATTASV